MAELINYCNEKEKIELIKILEQISNNKKFVKELKSYQKIKRFPQSQNDIDIAYKNCHKLVENILLMDDEEILSRVDAILDLLKEFGDILEKISTPCSTEWVYDEYPPDFFMHQFDDCQELKTQDDIRIFKDGIKLDLSLCDQADCKEKLLTMAHVFAFIPCLMT